MLAARLTVRTLVVTLAAALCAAGCGSDDAGSTDAAASAGAKGSTRAAKDGLSNIENPLMTALEAFARTQKPKPELKVDDSGDVPVGRAIWSEGSADDPMNASKCSIATPAANMIMDGKPFQLVMVFPDGELACED